MKKWLLRAAGLVVSAVLIVVVLAWITLARQPANTGW